MIDFLDRTKPKFALENKHYQKFLIVSGPRTGSSYLSSLLRSHPDIISYSELFHHNRVVLGPDHKLIEPQTLLSYRHNAPVDFVESIYRSDYSAHISAVGFKLLYSQAHTKNESVLWHWLEQNKDIHIIHLVRKNMLAQYLSIRQALVRQQWTTTKQTGDEPLRIALPDDECENMFRQTEGAIIRTRSRFKSHPYLEIEYEDLTENTNVIIANLFQFLDVSAHPLTTDLVRMNPWSPEICIRNYGDLKDRFQHTQWARFF